MSSFLRKNFLSLDVVNSTISLKEMSVFSMFFAKVRYLPYYAKKSAKKSTFFKRNCAFLRLF